MSSTIDNSAVYKQLGLSQPAGSEAKKSGEMGQEDFMQLMIAQLQNQDPFEPMENGDFLAQIAQFTTTTGVQDLQSSFDNVATSMQSSQALQASTLVGRSVLVPSDAGTFTGAAPMQGVAELPASTSQLNVTIYDASGQAVRQIPMGAQPEGQIPLNWDGLSDGGQQMPPGIYYVEANALVDGKKEAVETHMAAQVDSVTLGKNGTAPTLNLRGLGPMSFNDVTRIF